MLNMWGQLTLPCSHSVFQIMLWLSQDHKMPAKGSANHPLAHDLLSREDDAESHKDNSVKLDYFEKRGLFADV